MNADPGCATTSLLSAGWSKCPGIRAFLQIPAYYSRQDRFTLGVMPLTMNDEHPMKTPTASLVYKLGQSLLRLSAA
jgi:hypothetical protein